MARPEQHICTGLLLFRQAAGSLGLPPTAYESACYGVSATQRDVVDLQEHHATRNLPRGSDDAQLFSFACIGQAIYQHRPDAMDDTPPPFCLGVEFLRYACAVNEQPRMLAATQQPLVTASSAAAGHPAGLATHISALAEQLDSTEIRQQPNHSSSTSSSQHASKPHSPMQPTSSSNSQPSEELGFIKRLLKKHAEVSSRLEGKDPLWFAKAFATRAELNWAFMKQMAGDIAAAVKQDVGLQERDD